MEKMSFLLLLSYSFTSIVWAQNTFENDLAHVLQLYEQDSPDSKNLDFLDKFLSSNIIIEPLDEDFSRTSPNAGPILAHSNTPFEPGPSKLNHTPRSAHFSGDKLQQEIAYQQIDAVSSRSLQDLHTLPSSPQTPVTAYNPLSNTDYLYAPQNIEEQKLTEAIRRFLDDAHIGNNFFDLSEFPQTPSPHISDYTYPPALLDPVTELYPYQATQDKMQAELSSACTPENASSAWCPTAFELPQENIPRSDPKSIEPLSLAPQQNYILYYKTSNSLNQARNIQNINELPKPVAKILDMMNLSNARVFVVHDDVLGTADSYQAQTQYKIITDSSAHDNQTENWRSQLTQKLNPHDLDNSSVAVLFVEKDPQSGSLIPSQSLFINQTPPSKEGFYIQIGAFKEKPILERNITKVKSFLKVGILVTKSPGGLMRLSLGPFPTKDLHTIKQTLANQGYKDLWIKDSL